LGREKYERAADGEEQLVETVDDEIRERRRLGARPVHSGPDVTREEDTRDESYRYVVQRPPGPISDPTEGGSEARVLDRLEDSEYVQGRVRAGSGLPDGERLARSLMKGARNAKGDRSGEQPQNLINNARNLDTAVPMARPTQTMVDQET